MSYKQEKVELMRLSSPFPAAQKKEMDFVIRKVEAKGWTFVKATEAETRKRAKSFQKAMNLHFSRMVEGEQDDYDDDDYDD